MVQVLAHTPVSNYDVIVFLYVFMHLFQFAFGCMDCGLKLYILVLYMCCLPISFDPRFSAIFLSLVSKIGLSCI